MKKIDFGKLKTTTDGKKLVPVLEHTFHPFEDDKDISVECKYISQGNADNIYSMDASGKMSINMDWIFRNCVTKINGITITIDDKDIEATPEFILSLPMNAFLSELKNKVVMHLISQKDLNEDEAKN